MLPGFSFKEYFMDTVYVIVYFHLLLNDKFKMPRLCNCYGCKGNYPGEPYTKTVSFPKEPEERERWIQAMPNPPASLRSLKEINICASHFDCAWKSCRGGSRPLEPPSVFPANIPKSCLKQIPTKRRSTSLSTAEARTKKTRLTAEELDRITDFDSFCLQFPKKFSTLTCICRNDEFFCLQNGRNWP